MTRSTRDLGSERLYFISLRTTRTMPEVDILFSPEQASAGSFRLLELPPDLCKRIESSESDLKCVLHEVNIIIQTIP
jgi:hypothetical protein